MKSEQLIKEWNQNWVFYVTFIVACFCLSSLVVMSVNRKSHDSPMLILLQMSHTYQSRGIEGFLEEKRKLKKAIHTTLADRDTEMQKAAVNIAVYLFPELLPSKQLERGVASDFWIPHQQLIEQSPGTRQSREAFERMRANIWNYENPSRTTSELSAQAQQILSIYETLTSP